MSTQEASEYDESLRKRVILIIQLSGLEVKGFAEFVGVSLSHLYAVINGNRALTQETVRRICKKFNLKEDRFFRLDYEIPANISKAPELLEFMAKEKDISEYFQNTRDDRIPSHYIEHELVKSSLFKEDEPTYLWEVREYCEKEERVYSSNELSKLLKYQVKKGNLRSTKRPIKCRDGTYGIRMVDVFFKSKAH